MRTGDLSLAKSESTVLFYGGIHLFHNYVHVFSPFYVLFILFSFWGISPTAVGDQGVALEPQAFEKA
jgi:hypothetical protein